MYQLITCRVWWIRKGKRVPTHSACVAPFPISGVWGAVRRQPPPPRREPAWSYYCLSSRALGAACERQTHLLFSKNPEVMELFNQGVGTASCWEEEELITDELFPFNTVVCSHRSHDYWWAVSLLGRTQTLTHKTWSSQRPDNTPHPHARVLQLLPGPRCGSGERSCMWPWPALSPLPIVIWTSWGPRTPCHFCPACHLSRIQSQGFVGPEGVSWQLLVHFTYLPPPGTASARWVKDEDGAAGRPVSMGWG